MGTELTIKGKLRRIDGEKSGSTCAQRAQGEISARGEMLAIWYRGMI